MRKLCLILLIIIHHNSLGQIKFYPEELAIYYIDSLTKIDPDFKEFKYTYFGQITENTTNTIIPSICNSNRPKTKISLTPEISIIEDSTLKKISIPIKMQRNGSAELLELDHFTKWNNMYYISFSQDNAEYSGKVGIIVMDINGILVDYCIMHYIE